MRIVDPENGSIFSIPCVIDYDMTSPSQQVSSYIITPNNHATVMVQGNQDTLRLFKLNTRYIFGGRPFKLLAYQNALIDDSIATTPTLLYLDLYLDEIHNKDDIENSIAYNGEYSYNIQIDAENMELLAGSTGNLTATVMYNGEEVTRNIIWSSSNTSAVMIDSNGYYQVVGQSGINSIISATLEGNDNVSANINIQIVDTESVQPLIILNPSFEKIRQFESINFAIEVMYGSSLINPEDIQISLSQDTVLLSNKYLTINQLGSQYTIIANSIALEPQILYINVKNTSPDFEVSKQFSIDVTSMLG